MASPDSPDNNINSELVETPEDDIKSLMSKNKGKLAVSAAATLGVMIYYAWKEKRMEKNEPEEYARLQRLKASIRAMEMEKRASENESADKEKQKK